MGLRLTVQRSPWQQHLDETAAALPGLIPVVKGNGYGFGRAVLMPFARQLTAPGDRIAVGTAYEAADVPADRTALVLTPHVDRLPTTLPTNAVLTVGSAQHLHALSAHGWQGRVCIKLGSSMRRYGTTPDALAALVHQAQHSGCTIDSASIHFPLVGTTTEHLAELTAWLPHLPHLGSGTLVSVSHIPPAGYAALRAEHPEVDWRIRVGTGLWHSHKELLRLTADVVDVFAVADGDTVGYRGVTVFADGHLVLVAAGSAHGVRALDDGRSPFHHARRRIDLLEPPHMHTSVLFVPLGDPLPSIGERIDVQRPLIATIVDELEWTGESGVDR